MSWQLWTVAGVLALGAVLNIYHTGKDREPTTPGLVVAIVMMNGLLIGLIFWGVA